VKTRLACAAFALVFALLVALGVHGYSLPLWHAHIDGSAMTEVKAGKPRAIRSDDWWAEIPYALAQRAATPAFPAENSTIGLGESMTASPVKAPVASPFTLFRPTLWGWFLGGDAGLAWNWWTLAAGLPLTVFLLARLLTRDAAASGLAAAAAFASPFFQAWSFHYSEIAVYGGLCVVMIDAVLGATPARARAAAAGLWFFASCLALNFYPGDQVCIGYTAALLSGLLLWRRRVDGAAGLRPRLVLAGVASLAAGLTVVAFFLANREQVAVVLDTAYPGRRVLSGGGFPWWRPFASTLLLPAFVRNWSAFGNSCEVAGFPLLLPSLTVFLALRGRDLSADARRAAWTLAAFAWLCFAFMVVGVPEWLARATLLSHVRDGRAQLPMGIALLLLFGVLVAAPRSPAPGRRGLAARTASVAVGALVLAGAELGFEGVFGFRARVAWLLAIPLATAVVSQAAVALPLNPVCVGGTRFLAENAMSRAIVEAHSKLPPGSRWAVYGDTFLVNLPRIVGVPSVGGTQATPQLAMWARFDPERRFATAENRYAHVFFRFAPPGEFHAENLCPDDLVVRAHPLDPAMTSLDVRAFLVAGEENLAEFRALAAAGRLTETWTGGKASVFVAGKSR